MVPTTARNAMDNESNVSAGSRVRTRILLDVEGEDAPARSVDVDVPNWLRIVLYYAGSNEGPADELPAEVRLDVRLHPSTGEVVSVDVAAAEAVLAPHQPAATRWWKETEAPLSSLRAARSLPGSALRGARNLAGTWRDAVAGMRSDIGRDGGPPRANATDQDIEQIRRSGTILRHQLDRDPRQREAVRTAALQAGPMMVANVRSGVMAPADLEAWLVLQETSGAVTPEEAAAWRAEAAPPH